MNKTIPLSSTVATVALAAILLFGNASQSLAATTFARDLTLGSSGSDVIALQTFLTSQGFGIPAGATGYFGSQTKAALASYQAAKGIIPAAGYFGPVTRASVNTGNTTTPPSTGGSSTDTTLSGGEASLRGFNLTSGNDLREADTDEEILSAEFDVRDGDVRVQRVTLEFTAENTSLNTQPWRYVDTLEVYNGSKRIGSVDVSSKNDWDKDGTTYSVDIPVDTIVKAGKSVELSVRADAQASIDSANLDQTFSIVIPENGIRAIDGEKIQHYIGSDSDTVSLGFNGEDNGKLSVRESSDNPDAGVIVAESNKTSDKTDVLVFDLHNTNEADVDLTDLAIRVDASFADGDVADEDVDDIIRTATLKLDGKTYQGKILATDSGSHEGVITFKNLKTVVAGDDTVEGTLTVQLNGSNNRFDSGAVLSFDVLAADVEAEGSQSGDDTEVSGQAGGNLMTVTSESGINVEGATNTAVIERNSNDASKSFGLYTLKFKVTAVGDQVFVPRAVALDGAATTTAGVRIVSLINEFTGTANTLMTSSAKQYNDDYFIVQDGKTETFTVTASLDPDTTGYYQLGIDFVQFSPTALDFNSLQKLDMEQNKAKFSTDPLYIPN